MPITDFDDIFPHVGGFGPYQYILFGAVCFGYVVYVFCIYGQLFMTLAPPHWCNSDTNLVDLTSLGFNVSSDDLVQWTVPPNDGGEGYQSCSRYDINITQVLSSGASSPNESWPTIGCTHGWSYNFSSYYYPTITTELDLVCESDWMPPFSQSLFFIGSIFGGPLFGWLGDYFGRLPVAVSSNLISGIFGIWSGFSGGYISFCIARFFVGFATDTNTMIIYILAVEYVSAEYRSIIANAPILICLTGTMVILPWLAIGIGNWRILAIAIALPHFLSLLLPFLIPESARWLIEKGKSDKAMTIVEEIANKNGKSLTDNFKSDFKDYMEKSHQQSIGKSANYLDLLRTPTLRKRFLLLCIMWIATIVAYDANVRSSAVIGGNLFVTFTLLGAMEAPADLLTIVLMDRIGRRYTNVLSLTFAGVCFFGTAALPPDSSLWSLITMSLIGRFFITMAANTGQQFAIEILPTVARAQGSGMVHTLGQGMIFVTPYIVYLAKYVTWGPYVIIGAISITGGLFTFFLPETLGENIPDSLEDGENAFKNQPFFYNPLKRFHSKDGETNQAFEKELTIENTNI